MRQVRKYLIIVFVLSLPLWILGFVFDVAAMIPIKLPLSALQFLCVLAAAVIVTKRDGGHILPLLKRGFDIALISQKRWRYSLFLLMPVLVLATYAITPGSKINAIDKLTPLWSIPIFMASYSVSGYCEQLGWTAIATDRLLTQYNFVRTGLTIGIIWAAWHIIPFIQTHHSPDWILWQCIFTIVFRVLLTNVYILTNRSVFSTIVLHASYNTTFSMLPYYGSSYNPMYMAGVTFLALSIISLSTRGQEFQTPGHRK